MTEHMRGGGASVAREEEDGRAEERRRAEDGMVFVRERSLSRVGIIVASMEVVWCLEKWALGISETVPSGS